MKKLIGLLAIAGMVFLSCGPSAEEKAALEQAKQDSIAKVQADSIAAVEAAAAEAAALEQARLDSVRVADSLAAIAAKPAKGGKAAKAAPKTEVKKAEAPATTEKKASKMQGAKKTN